MKKNKYSKNIGVMDIEIIQDKNGYDKAVQVDCMEFMRLVYEGKNKNSDFFKSILTHLVKVKKIAEDKYEATCIFGKTNDAEQNDEE